MIREVFSNVCHGEFLDLPYVTPAAIIGISSTIMGIALHSLGFSFSTNVVTAMFVVGGCMGASVMAIGMIAYSILACAEYRANHFILDNRDVTSKPLET